MTLIERLFSGIVFLIAVNPGLGEGQSQSTGKIEFVPDLPAAFYIEAHEVNLVFERRVETRILSSDRLLATIVYPEVPVELISSKEKTSAVLLLRRIIDGDYDYSALLVLSRTSSGEITAERRFSQDTIPMENRHGWVSELGALSGDGRVALLRMGRPSSPTPPYRVNYVWETWDLETPKLLKTGLSLCN